MPSPRPTSSSTGTSAATKRRASASRPCSTTTSPLFKSAQPNSQPKTSKRMSDRGVWSEEEHDKFLVGIKLYPKGPWKMIAAQVGTRSARQVQTHAQKYYEKVARRLRGLRKDRRKLVRPEHRLDDDMMSLCKVAEFDMSGARLTIGPIGRGLGVQSSLAATEAETEASENAALAQTFASLTPLSTKTVAVSETPTKLQVEVASSPSSPMGVDTVANVKFHDDDDLKLHADQDTEDDDKVQSFVSLLTGEGDSIYFDFGDDCSTTDESLSDDTSTAGSDETDSLVDLDDIDDHYLDYLMEVLDTEDQIGQDFSCADYFCLT